MATGTAEREAEPGGARGIDAVDDVFDAPFFRDQSPFAIDAMIAVETCGDELGVAWLRQ